MARTKKYLANASRIKTTHSFYRPLKRLNTSTTSFSDNAVNFHKPKQVILPRKKLADDFTQQQIQLEKVEEINNSYLINKRENQLTKENKKVDDQTISLDFDNQEKPPEKLPISTQIITSPVEENSENNEVDFNSHDMSEDISKLELGINKSMQKDQKISDDLKEIRVQFEKEKEKMEKTIHVLKKEIEHREPLHENKFFTISKELKNITEAMNHLLENEAWDSNASQVIQPTVINSNVQKSNPVAPTISQQMKIISGNSPSQTTAQTELPENKTTESQSNTEKSAIPSVETKPIQPQESSPIIADAQPTEDKPIKMKRKVPKAITILISTLLLMSMIAGGIWYSFNKKPEVNAQLVQQYMPNDAKTPPPSSQPKEEKKINVSDTESTKSIEDSKQTKVQGASDSKYNESQADIPYSQTIWDTFKDPTIGVEVNYPKNSVNVVKTESSLTFLRKTGYIFKVQIYETALNAQEYWKSVQANNLSYNVKNTTFRDESALFLELEDITEFPGDKYIVKRGDYIYDIWYATYSKTLADDDVKRVEIMLNSFKFL